MAPSGAAALFSHLKVFLGIMFNQQNFVFCLEQPLHVVGIIGLHRY